MESISLFLLVGTTLVELRGTEPAVPAFDWWLLPWPLTNEIDFGAVGEAMGPLLVPPNCLIVFRWSLRLYVLEGPAFLF